MLKIDVFKLGTLFHQKTGVKATPIRFIVSHFPPASYCGVALFYYFGHVIVYFIILRGIDQVMIIHGHLNIGNDVWILT